MLRELGYESQIFATAVHPELEGRVRLLHELSGPSRRDRFLLYQLSSHSMLADWLSSRLEVVGVNYHNVTPSRLLHGWDRSVALALSDAELQVEQLARVAETGICVSRFNEADLRSKGWSSTSVAPVLVDLGGFDVEPDPATSKSLERLAEGGGSSWLFVGALSPHKAQHRLIQALALYRRVYDRSARLTLVGRPVVASYASSLGRYACALGLGDAVELTGAVDHRALVAHFHDADVFVSASEHEGFCVPVLEALYHRLPVVALAAGALPETLADAGVLVHERSPAALAAAVAWAVRGGPERRRELAEASERRLEHFTLEETRAQMARVVRDWVGSHEAR